jgi:hypothetical protein
MWNLLMEAKGNLNRSQSRSLESRTPTRGAPLIKEIQIDVDKGKPLI